MTHSADWRLMGQERYLRGAELQWSSYRAFREDWDHDHCEFCGVRFAEAGSGPAVGATSEVMNAGYTTTENYAKGAEYVWICPSCFADFADSFEWTVVGDDG